VCAVFDEAIKDFAPVVGDGKNDAVLNAGCVKGNNDASSPAYQSDYRTTVTLNPQFSSPRQSER